MALASGRGRRKLRREMVLNQANDLVEPFLAELAAHHPPEEDYLKQLDALFADFRKRFRFAREVAAAVNHTISRIEQGNIEGLWSLPLPGDMVKLRRHRQPRTLSRHRRAARAAELARKFLKAAEKPEVFQSLSIEQRLHLVALSAILFGGLNRPAAVRALVKALREGERCRAHAGRYWWDLCLGGTQALCNYKRDDELQHWFRWFVDPLTLCFLARYQAAALISPPTLRGPQIDEGIAEVIRALGIRYSSKLSLSALAEAGIAAAEHQDGVSISSALVEVACGRNLTVGLTPSHWAYLLSPNILNLGRIDYSDFVAFPLQRSKGARRRSGSALSMEFWALKKAVAPPKDSRQKLTIDQVKQELRSLDVSMWSVAGEVLRDWYLHHMEERGNSATTPNRYHQAVAKWWFDEAERADYLERDSEEWESFYENVSESFGSKHKARDYTMQRLRDLHNFCVDRHGVAPAVVYPEGAGAGKPNFVRANYVSVALYRAVLATIPQVEGLPTYYGARCLRLITVLAYRLGLRIGEILKLRLVDVQIEAGWLYIRESQFGDNKSQAALRKVPAKALMGETEWDEFSGWCGERFRYASSVEELIFTPDGDGQKRWDQRSVSRLVGGLLKSLSGQSDLVFHSFRHTALSNLHLVIEREWNLAEQVTGFGPEQLQKIFNAIVNHPEERLRIYWALATLAGHDTPSTTFSRYLHFSDWLIGEKLSRAKRQLTINQVKSITGLTAHRITRQLGRIVDEIVVDSECWTRLLVEMQFQAESISAELSEPPSIDEPASVSLGKAVPHDQAYKILTDYQEGVSIENLAYKYNVQDKRIRDWVNNAVELANLTTREGKPRLISVDRKRRSRPVIVPARLRSHAERDDATMIISALRRGFMRSSEMRESLIEQITYYLRSVTTADSGIKFNDPDRLSAFINTLGEAEAIPVSRWRLKFIFPSDNNLRKPWENLSITVESECRHVAKAKVVTAYLYLRHPEEAQLRSGPSRFRSYSARTLRYVFHMIAIMQMRSPKWGADT